MQYHLKILHNLGKVKEDLNELYLNQVLRQIAFSLIGVFVPIYLFSLGFTLETALLFMAVQWGSLGLFSLLSAEIGPRVGLKRTIVISTPLYVVYFLTIAVVNMYTPLLLIFSISILGGFTQSLYWTSLHSEFVKNSHKIHEGREVGNLMSFPAFVGIFTPLIGSFILKFLGYEMLSLIVVLITLLSGVPLLLKKDYKGFNFQIERFRLKKDLAKSWVLWGAADMLESLIWPFFIFIAVKDFIFIGAASMFSGIGTALFIMIIGRLSEKTNRSKLIKIGAVLFALVWIGRIFFQDIFSVMIFSFLAGMFFTLINVPLYIDFCNFSKKHHILGSVISREMWLTVGRVVTLVFIILLIPLITLSSLFTIAFILSAILSLLFLFRRKE